MSKSKIVTVSYNNAEKINDLEDGVIVAFLPEEASFEKSYEDSIISILDDDRIKIVTTDILVNLKVKRLKYIKYFVSDNEDVPIFFKKQSGMKVNGKIRPKDIIMAVISNGFYIEHLSEPAIEVQNELTVY